jgi:hypothetical protein
VEIVDKADCPVIVEMNLNNMSQLIVVLNFWESKQLEYWLTDNYPECKLRSLYDKFTGPEEPDWYALEGDLDDELVYYLKLKYGDKIRGGLRFGHVKNQ